MAINYSVIKQHKNLKYVALQLIVTHYGYQ